MSASGKKQLSGRTGFSYFLPFLLWGAVTAFFIFFVFRFVDFSPKVDENFFFSSNDPEFQMDKLISRMFSQEPEITLGARGNIYSQDYLRKIRRLTGELSSAPGTDTVQSLTKGPKNTEEALKSPLWRRVLFSEHRHSSFIYVFLKENASIEAGVREVEKIKQRLDSPDFQLMVSGTPYVEELIRRNLTHDLKVFSIVAYCVIGLFGPLISRSVLMVLGTLIACTNAGCLTLFLTHAFGIPIGPLTANLSTIVVFMTFNWQLIFRTGETSGEKAWRLAVTVSVWASSLSSCWAFSGIFRSLQTSSQRLPPISPSASA